MATRTVKARVELDGEKQYKQALSELNQGNKVLASEMRKLQAEYKGNAESTEFLTKKGDLLQRQLQQQQDKVSKLKEALQASAEKYGEADKRTQDWIIKLNNAEAAEFDLQHAIEENNAALQGEDNTMVSLGDTVESLADKLGIQLPDGAKKALDGMGSFSAGTVAKMAIAAAAVAAVIKVVKELGEITMQVAADMDKYLTESAITGVSTEMLQAWDYAAPLIDTDAETIKGAMTKITKAMGDARDGNVEAAAKFADLGVSITDASGQLRSSEEVFYDVIDALGQMDAGAERDALSMDLMGKSAQELNPLIEAGSNALKGYGKEAENVGFILSKDQVKALGAVDDAYQKLQLQIEANKKQLAADFAPAAQAAMELFADVVKKAGEWLKRSGLIENLSLIIQSLVDIFRTAGEIMSGIPGFDQQLGVLKITLGAIAQLIAVIADGFALVKSLLTLDFRGAADALGFGYGSGRANNLQRTIMQQNGEWQDYQDFYSSSQWSGFTPDESMYGYDSASGQYYDRNTGNYVSFNATGNDNWRGGLTWVGEGGPELAYLPRGTQILNAQDSRRFGGDTFYITIDAASVREFNDIVELAKSARVRGRMR